MAREIGRVGQNRLGFSVRLESTGTSKAYTITGDVVYIITTVIFPTGYGEANVQVSTSSVDDIEDGLANWIDWEYGVVVKDTQDCCFAPNAVRLVNVDDTPVILEVKGILG